MPRHDFFEIDYSLGGPALFSNGGSLGWHKDEKNLVLEQIVAKSNFLLQLPCDCFSLPGLLSFIPAFVPFLGFF